MRNSYLIRNESTGHLILEDWNAKLPDEVVETVPAHNPLPGLSLMRRVATAERSISTALGLTYPPWIDSIADDLAPYANVTYDNGEAPADTRVWVQSDGVAWQDRYDLSAHRARPYLASYAPVSRLRSAWQFQLVGSLLVGDLPALPVGIGARPRCRRDDAAHCSGVREIFRLRLQLNASAQLHTSEEGQGRRLTGATN